MRAVLISMVMAVTGVAHAAQLEGSLLVQWGDAQPGSGQADEIRVQLDTGGDVVELDLDQSLMGAEDLYALQGERVIVEAAPGAKSSTGTLQPQLILPAGGTEAKSTAEPTESRPWVVLLCRFADIPSEPEPPGYFSAMYGPGADQLGGYWSRMSQGRVEMNEGRVYGWYGLPQVRTAYLRSSGSADLAKLFNDCIAAADAEVDFSNGGQGIAGIQLMFNASLDCCAWAGRLRTTLDGLTDTWRVAWLPPFAYQNVSGLAHEIGHTFGLPHSNNADGDADPYDNVWDVMSDPYRRSVPDPVYGSLPKGLSAYQRDRAGWIAPERRLAVGPDAQVRTELSLLGRGDGVDLVIVQPDADADWRSLVIEARSPQVFEDGRLPDAAVIMHSIDTTRREPAWAVDADPVVADVNDNEGSMFRVGESWRTGDGAVTVRVLAQTETGFEVEIRTVPVLFGNDFG